MPTRHIFVHNVGQAYVMSCLSGLNRLIEMKKKIFWIPFAVLSVLIGLYPLKYLLNAGKIGILNGKPDWLLNSETWKLSFYTHIVLGGVALLIGWIQFNKKLRLHKPYVHQFIGKIYVVSVLLSSFSGFYIALFADQGLWASLGFSCLAVIWFYTTLMAYLAVRNKQFLRHQNMMIYSYAACFAAVTLRIWLPVLIIIIGDYGTCYIIVAWLSWIPNLFVAYLIVKRAAFNNILIAKS
ncbi:putative membrane protein [Mucilaginibacter sp. OAE612]